MAAFGEREEDQNRHHEMLRERGHWWWFSTWMAPKGEKSFAKKKKKKWKSFGSFDEPEKRVVCRIRGIGRNGAIFTQQWHFSLPSSFLSISTCPSHLSPAGRLFVFPLQKKKKFDKIHFLLLFSPPFGMWFFFFFPLRLVAVVFSWLNKELLLLSP